MLTRHQAATHPATDWEQRLQPASMWAAFTAAMAAWSAAGALAGPREPGAAPGGLPAPIVPVVLNENPPSALDPEAVDFFTRTTGKLFPTNCTATVVESESGDLLWTAGHCVWNGGFLTPFSFVPGYDNGRQPYGEWVARDWGVTQAWQQNLTADVGVVLLEPLYGRHIQDVLGAQRLTFTNSSVGQPVYQLGYPSEALELADGQIPYSPTGEQLYVAHAQTVPPAELGWNSTTAYDDLGIIPLAQFAVSSGYWTPGASGGPWLAAVSNATGQGQLIAALSRHFEGLVTGSHDTWLEAPGSAAALTGLAQALYEQYQNRSVPAGTPTMLIHVANRGAFHSVTTVTAGTQQPATILRLGAGQSATANITLANATTYSVRGDATLGKYKLYPDLPLPRSPQVCFEYRGTTFIGFDFRQVDCDTGAPIPAAGQQGVNPGPLARAVTGLTTAGALALFAAGTLIRRRRRAAAPAGDDIDLPQTSPPGHAPTTTAPPSAGQQAPAPPAGQQTPATTPAAPAPPPARQQAPPPPGAPRTGPVTSEPPTTTTTTAAPPASVPARAGRPAPGQAPPPPAGQQQPAPASVPAAIPIPGGVASLPPTDLPDGPGLRLDPGDDAYIVMLGSDRDGTPLLWHPSTRTWQPAGTQALSQYLRAHRPASWPGSTLRILSATPLPTAPALQQFYQQTLAAAAQQWEPAPQPPAPPRPEPAPAPAPASPATPPAHTTPQPPPTPATHQPATSPQYTRASARPAGPTPPATRTPHPQDGPFSWAPGGRGSRCTEVSARPRRRRQRRRSWPAAGAGGAGRAVLQPGQAGEPSGESPADTPVPDRRGAGDRYRASGVAPDIPQPGRASQPGGDLADAQPASATARGLAVRNLRGGGPSWRDRLGLRDWPGPTAPSGAPPAPPAAPGSLVLPVGLSLASADDPLLGSGLTVPAGLLEGNGADWFVVAAPWRDGGLAEAVPDPVSGGTRYQPVTAAGLAARIARDPSWRRGMRVLLVADWAARPDMTGRDDPRAQVSEVSAPLGWQVHQELVALGAEAAQVKAPWGAITRGDDGTVMAKAGLGPSWVSFADGSHPVFAIPAGNPPQELVDAAVRFRTRDHNVTGISIGTDDRDTLQGIHPAGRDFLLLALRVRTARPVRTGCGWRSTPRWGVSRAYARDSPGQDARRFTSTLMPRPVGWR